VPSSTSATGPPPPPLFFAFRHRFRCVRAVLIIIIYQLPPETITDGREIVIWVLLDFGHTPNNSLRRSRNKRHPALSLSRPLTHRPPTPTTSGPTPMILLSPRGMSFRPFLFRNTHVYKDYLIDLRSGRKIVDISDKKCTDRTYVYGFSLPSSRNNDDSNSSEDRYFIRKIKKTELFEPKTFENGYGLYYGVVVPSHAIFVTTQINNMIYLFH
jgi:hypothetical protein